MGRKSSFFISITFIIIAGIVPQPQPELGSVRAQANSQACISIKELENGRAALFNNCSSAIWFSMCYKKVGDKVIIDGIPPPRCENDEFSESLIGENGHPQGRDYFEIGMTAQVKNGIAWVECTDVKGGKLGFTDDPHHYNSRAGLFTAKCAESSVISRSFSSATQPTAPKNTAQTPLSPVVTPPSAAGSMSTQARDPKTYQEEHANGCISIHSGILENTCAFTVTASWCGEGVDCKNGRFRNLWNIGSGRHYSTLSPPGTFIRFAACKGPDTLEQDMKGEPYSFFCRIPLR
jgi:hypothetical protein